MQVNNIAYEDEMTSQIIRLTNGYPYDFDIVLLQYQGLMQKLH